MNDKNWLEYWVDPQTWEFRGDFEGIFSDFEDPWNCRERINSLERKVLTTIASFEEHDSVLDVGCGLGVYTEMLRRSTRANQAVGIDVSPTAVEKAAKINPQCEFKVVDLMKDQLSFSPKSFSLIVVTEVLWYVLPKLKEIFVDLHGILKDDGILLIEQYFPTDQKFGLDYLDSPEMLETKYLIPAGFEISTRLDYKENGEKVAIFKCNKAQTPQ